MASTQKWCLYLQPFFLFFHAGNMASECSFSVMLFIITIFFFLLTDHQSSSPPNSRVFGILYNNSFAYYVILVCLMSFRDGDLQNWKQFSFRWTFYFSLPHNKILFATRINQNLNRKKGRTTSNAPPYPIFWLIQLIESSIWKPLEARLERFWKH